MAVKLPINSVTLPNNKNWTNIVFKKLNIEYGPLVGFNSVIVQIKFKKF